MTLVTANVNSLWGTLIVEELVRHGVTQFVISPGSRSAPLIAGVANTEQAEAIIHFDERGAAFFALGYARATCRPVALICTSGTAVANYLPAVVEAAVDTVPLILLTADRPPELRDTGANQTIIQPGIFSHYVRWQFDFPCPDTSIPGEVVLTAVDQAVYRATSSPAGPVHLNLMFREPLAPVDVKGSFAGYMGPIDRWFTGGKPHTVYSGPESTIAAKTVDTVADIVSKSLRGLLVVGQLRTDDERRAVAELSGQLGWPMLADISSGLRGEELHARVDYYDTLLASNRFADHHMPDCVLQIGGRLTSKRLLTYLEYALPVHYVMVADHPFRQDPIQRVTDRIQCQPHVFCAALRARVTEGPTTQWLTDWRVASQQVVAHVEKTFASATALSEPLVARIVSSELAPHAELWLASSMPIRDMDQFSDPHARWLTVVANRGASGIDGTVASAAGYAAGSRKPVVLLIGDLAMLHDLNSLALLRNPGIKVTIVVLNNNGGGIFGHLPVAGFPDLFEKYFLTPHNFNFEHAAQQFCVAYAKVGSADAFTDAFRTAQTGSGCTLIEVPIAREQNQKLHAEFITDVMKQLDKDCKD